MVHQLLRNIGLGLGRLMGFLRSEIDIVMQLNQKIHQTTKDQARAQRRHTVVMKHPG